MRQARQPLDRPVAILLLGCLTAVMAACLALRMLAVEMSLPQALRLDEMRLFGAVAVQPTAQWFEDAAPDPLRIHAHHAACEADLRNSMGVHDFAGAEAARVQCLAAVEETLAQAPANGRLWLEKARLIHEISGPTAAFHESLLASWKTAPRAGWIALERLRLSASVWMFLPEPSRKLAAEDAMTIASAPELSQAFARDYRAFVSLRPALAEIITQRLPARQQQRLIRALEQVAK